MTKRTYETVLPGRHDRNGGRHQIGTVRGSALEYPGGIIGIRTIVMGKHVMVAGIDAANPASIRLHQRLGFEQVGTLREVGTKFGHWLDLVFMQRFLGSPGSTPTPMARTVP